MGAYLGTPSSYLTIGGFPGEPGGEGRPHYVIPGMEFLDKEAPEGTPGVYTINFSDAEQLRIFSEGHTYDEIIFDDSTIKFFKYPADTVESRLGYLRNMLKPDGKMYIPGAGSSPGGVRMGGNTTNYRELFELQCDRVGLRHIEQPLRECSPQAQSVLSHYIRDGDMPIFVASKIRPANENTHAMNTNERREKTRRKRNRKSFRKSRLQRKNI